MTEMILKILLPQKILLQTVSTKIIAEAQNGSFTLLPRHIDFLATLVPGILMYEKNDEEYFMAVDRGILVKHGYEVLVSVQNAVEGPDLGTLEQMVREQFETMDEREKSTQSVMSRLEVDFIRHFIEMQEKKV